MARAPAHAHKPNRMELDLRVIPFLRVLIISCVRVAYQSQVQLPRFCGLSNSIGGFQPIPKYIVNWDHHRHVKYKKQKNWKHVKEYCTWKCEYHSLYGSHCVGSVCSGCSFLENMYIITLDAKALRLLESWFKQCGLLMMLMFARSITSISTKQKHHAFGQLPTKFTVLF